MTDANGSPGGQPYVRMLEIPPGAPWDQARAARLEAAHGAPLGGETLLWALARMEPWRPRAPTRYAVAYVRREAAPGAPLAVDVNGRAVRFRFPFPAGRGRIRLAGRGMTVVLAGLVAVVAALDLPKALDLRGAREQALARLEANAQRWERLARRERQQRADAALLRKTGADRASFADLAADLFWLGQARAPSVAIQRVQWRPDQMQVTSLGPGAPVLGSERRIERLGEGAGVSEWRIGGQPVQVVRAGAARPSVMLSQAERAAEGGR